MICQGNKQMLRAKKCLESLQQLLHHLGQQGQRLVEVVDMVGKMCKSPLLLYKCNQAL
jgi:hypothetical protein